MFGEPITYGGQESVVYNMLSTFDLKNDFSIDLFTPYFVDNDKLIKLTNENSGKIYNLNIDFKTGDNRFLLSKPVDIFFNEHKNYDIVHIHTGSLTTMLVYARLAKKNNIKKVIVHSHTTGNNISIITKIRRYILTNFLNEYVDIYIGCSEDSINFKFYRKAIKKPIIVQNGIDINGFKYDEICRDNIRKKYNLNDKFVVGSLGRLSFEKNNLFMIDLIYKLSKINNNIVLMIVGDGDYEIVLKDKVNELNLTNFVIFTGNQKNSYEYYNAFDCFILPSFYEGMPVAAIEAQVSGLPTFISDTITRECCISNVTKFLNINDINSWASSILRLVEDKNFSRKKCKIDIDKFDRDNTYKVIKEIYFNI